MEKTTNSSINTKATDIVEEVTISTSDMVPKEDTTPETPKKIFHVWIIDIAIIIISALLLYLLYRRFGDYQSAIQIGPFNQGIITKALCFIFSISLMLLPALIYNDFKKKRTFGWVVCTIIVVLLMVGSLYVSIISERSILGVYNIKFEGHSYGDYDYVVSVDNDVWGNTLYTYYYRSSYFTYTIFASSYLTEEEAVEWTEDSLIIYDFNDTFTGIYLEAFYIP